MLFVFIGHIDLALVDDNRNIPSMCHCSFRFVVIVVPVLVMVLFPLLYIKYTKSYPYSLDLIV